MSRAASLADNRCEGEGPCLAAGGGGGVPTVEDPSVEAEGEENDGVEEPSVEAEGEEDEGHWRDGVDAGMVVTAATVVLVDTAGRKLLVVTSTSR